MDVPSPARLGLARADEFPVRVLGRAPHRPGGVRTRLRQAVLAALVTAASAALLAQSGPPVPSPTDAQLFDDTVLQRLDLQVSDRDWATLRANYLLNAYYPATFQWRGQTVRNVGIRSRGSGTRNGQKPGLLVDFNRYVTGQHFLGLKALVLDNHLQDASAMREALTMAVHARLGLPAPREAPAALYVNGQFFGVYTIVENVDAVSTRRMFAPPAAPSSLARFTLARLPDDPVRIPRPPNTPAPSPSPAPAPPSADAPTGYVYEYHWLDNFYATYPGADLAIYPPMLEAKTHETESIETLYRPIETLFREINQSADDQFADRVGALLDLQLFVKQVAVEAYMADWDGLVGSFGLNNFYLFRAAGGGPFRIVPWDEDNAFHALGYPVDADHDKHVLMRRTMQVPELRQLFFDTLHRVSQLAEARESDQGPTWLEREINRRRDLIAARLHDDLVKPHHDDDFVREVAANVDFARNRAAVVREQLQRLQQGQASRAR